MNDFTLFDDSVRSVWRYPGGEVGVRAVGEAPARLLARVHDSNELLALLMYLGAVPGQVQQVCIPYLPYARQDRVAAPGDPVAIAVLAKLLASTGVRSFATLDPHSSIAAEVFAAADCELTAISPMPWLERFLAPLQRGRSQRTWFVAPDKGARGRTAAAAAVASRPERPVGVLHCLKVRDPGTGKLQGFRIDEADSPRELGADPVVVIVDDICDGGGTFAGVATALRQRYGAGLPLHLWTTHGIYSKGLLELAATFTTIGATDSFLTSHTHPQLRILPLQAEQPR